MKKYVLKNIYDTKPNMEEVYLSEKEAKNSISDKVKDLFTVLELTPKMIGDNILSVVENKCREHGIKFINSPSFTVTMGGLECSGYYDSVKKELAVATMREDKEWQTTLLHEFSHLEQDLMGSECWKNTLLKIKKDDKSLDMTDMIDLWIDGKIELTKDELFFYVSSIAKMEYECEQMTSEKIKLFHLDTFISPEEYAQKALAYVLFYFDVMENKKWYNSKNAPYLNKAVYPLLPNELSFKPSELTKELFDSLKIDYSSCY